MISRLLDVTAVMCATSGCMSQHAKAMCMWCCGTYAPTNSLSISVCTCDITGHVSGKP